MKWWEKSGPTRCLPSFFQTANTTTSATSLLRNWKWKAQNHENPQLHHWCPLKILVINANSKNFRAAEYLSWWPCTSLGIKTFRWENFSPISRLNEEEQKPAPSKWFETKHTCRSITRADGTTKGTLFTNEGGASASACLPLHYCLAAAPQSIHLTPSASCLLNGDPNSRPACLTVLFGEADWCLWGEEFEEVTLVTSCATWYQPHPQTSERLMPHWLQ